MDIVSAIGHALWMAFAMFWEILWPLILGFGLSAVVQAVVSKSEMTRLLPNDSPRSLAIACGLGAEFVGGPLMVVLMALLFRLFLSRKLVTEARIQADRGLKGKMEGHAEMDMS